MNRRNSGWLRKSSLVRSRCGSCDGELRNCSGGDRTSTASIVNPAIRVKRLRGHHLPVEAKTADRPHHAPPADEEVRRRGRHSGETAALSRVKALLRDPFI